METQLVQYVYRRGDLVGCVIAKHFPELGKVCVSGSLCRNGVDRFNKHIGVNLARERAHVMAVGERDCALPYSLKEDIHNMVDRAHRYFKGVKVIAPLIKSNEAKHPDYVTW